MPRVAYITCDTPAWYEIAATMQRDEGWEPVYWIADRPVMDVLRQRFPGVIVHNRIQAYHMESPQELADMVVPPLDEPFLADLAPAQVVALKMADVVDSVDAFGFNERRRFFQQRLQYWRAVLMATRPDVAVFGFSAHVMYDYACYVLCRYYGIRTVMFEATFNFALLFPMEDPMVGSTDIAATYAGLVAADAGGEIPLLPVCDRYLERLRGNYDTALPWYMKLQYDALPKEIASTMYTGAPGATGAAARPPSGANLLVRLGVLSRRSRKP